MPTAVFRGEGVCRFGSPASPSVWKRAGMVFEDRVNYCPSRFRSVLASEERAIARDGISQQPFVWRLLARLFFDDKEFFLIADEFFALLLDPRRQPDAGMRSKLKAQIVCLSRGGGRVVK